LLQFKNPVDTCSGKNKKLGGSWAEYLSSFTYLTFSLHTMRKTNSEQWGSVNRPGIRRKWLPRIWN
jgi:hypothetical protein